MADKNKGKKVLTAKEANALKAEAEKKSREAKDLEEKEARAKDNEKNETMRVSVVKILNSIDGIEINIKEMKKNKSEICISCTQRATFCFTALDNEQISSCSEMCALTTMQAQFFKRYTETIKNGLKEAADLLLEGSLKIAEAIAVIPDEEKKSPPTLGDFITEAEKTLATAKIVLKTREQIIGNNFEARSQPEYKTQEVIRTVLTGIVDAETLKTLDPASEPKYGNDFNEEVAKLTQIKQQGVANVRHKRASVAFQKRQYQEKAEANKELPLEEANARLKNDFFGNKAVKQFMEKAQPIMEERKVLEEKLAINSKQLAECNNLAMATKCHEQMTAAKPILDMMRIFSQNVVIANAEGCIAEAQAEFQKSTEESLKKIFAVLVEHPEVKTIEAVKNWDINHVQLTDPLKSTWSETLQKMEETLAIVKQMATFVDQRDKCFQIATGTVFEKSYSKVAGGKELRDEKQKARQWFAAYNLEKEASTAAKKEIKALTEKLHIAENETAGFKASYDDAKKDVEEMKTLNQLAEKYYPKSAQKRESPGGWVKVKGTKKAKTEKKPFLPITYPDENGNQVPYCHFQFSKIDGCIKEDECEYAETHGMEDPHPNHHTRAAVDAARQAAYEKEEAKKQKEKKKVAPTGAKQAATAAKIPKKPDQKKKRVKSEQEESSSGTEDEPKGKQKGKPDDEDKADQENQDGTWY